jgi:hypothetical protein
MTIAEQMKAAEEAREFWKAMLPNVEPPEIRSFLLWTGVVDSAIVAHAISRVAAKFTKMQNTAAPMTVNDAYRYCTAVIRDEAKRLAA